MELVDFFEMQRRRMWALPNPRSLAASDKVRQAGRATNYMQNPDNIRVTFQEKRKKRDVTAHTQFKADDIRMSSIHVCQYQAILQKCRTVRHSTTGLRRLFFGNAASEVVNRPVVELGPYVLKSRLELVALSR
jgi:hypothetical protein